MKPKEIVFDILDQSENLFIFLKRMKWIWMLVLLMIFIADGANVTQVCDSERQQCLEKYKSDGCSISFTCQMKSPPNIDLECCCVKSSFTSASKDCYRRSFDPDAKPVNIGLIVGVCVGGLVVIGIAYFFWRRYKQNQQSYQPIMHNHHGGYSST